MRRHRARRAPRAAPGWMDRSMEKAQGHRMRTGGARAVATRARLVAQAERGGRVRVVRAGATRSRARAACSPHEGALANCVGGTVGRCVAVCELRARSVVRLRGCLRMLVPGQRRQRGRRGSCLPAVQPHHRGRARRARARPERRRAAVKVPNSTPPAAAAAQCCEHCSLVLLRLGHAFVPKLLASSGPGSGLGRWGALESTRDGGRGAWA